MKRQNSSTLGEAISLWIDAMKMRRQVDEARLISSWKPMVGDYMASKTRNIYISDRKLFVFIDSSVVRNELSMAKAMLIRRLNEEGGGDIIDDIIFK